MTAHERERLAAWLDDELAPSERAEVEAHVAACGECAAVLAEMEGVDELARAAAVEAPPGYFETLPGRVRARIEGTTRAPAVVPPTRGPRRMPVWTWAAAAALLLAVLTPLTLDRLALERSPSFETSNQARPAAPPAPTALAKGEEAEAEPAEGDDAAARVARSREHERPKEERAGGYQPALAPAPAPAPGAIGAATSTPPTPLPASSAERRLAPPPESRSPERVSPLATPGKAPPPADETAPEDVESRSGLRSQGARDELVAGDAALEEATVTAAAPPTGRAAAPKGVELREGLAWPERKAVAQDFRAFSLLVHERPASAAGWREHRERWRAFLEAHPGSPHADEARVRAIEAGVEAWKAGGDPGDLARAREDADAYLAREDAGQKERVRRVLAAVEGG